MFTGIIKEIGTVLHEKESPSGKNLVIGCAKTLKRTNVGDSVAIDGVCQTITKITDNSLHVQTISTTLKKTTLKNLIKGDQVNLEWALCLSDHMDGHLVQGHVNGTAILSSIEKHEIFTFDIPDSLTPFVVLEGSITLAGVSLTVSSLQANKVKVSLIPHTLKNTTFGNMKPGKNVNIEVDVIGKYVAKQIAVFFNKRETREI